MICDYYAELFDLLPEKSISKDKLLRLKIKLCKKHHVTKVPTDIELLLHCPIDKISSLRRKLRAKPTRSLSGVCIIAIMSRPAECPHITSAENPEGVGPCIMCPGGPSSDFGDVPRSYTGKEPATMRGIRNKFDPYLQVMNRLEQYIAAGHVPEKTELIIMGGTFPAQDIKYQYYFVAYAFKAMNDFSDKFYHKKTGLNIVEFKKFFELPGNVGDPKRTRNIIAKLEKTRGIAKLEKEQKRNENSRIRCVGLTIETRPDYALPEHCEQMLKLGATKVELGIQTVHNSVLKKIRRGHTVEDSINATRTLKDFGFKIAYHVMLGLPGATSEMDAECLRQIFKNPEFRPDMLKIYPCMVMKGTRLYDEWKSGRFKPLETKEAAEIIAEFKKNVPKYVRIMRIQRDIPTTAIAAGVDRTNLRQYVFSIMQKKGEKCNCIRCNEIGRVAKAGIKPKSSTNTEYNHKKHNASISINAEYDYERYGTSIGLNAEHNYERYDASQGKEYFIYSEDKNTKGIIGFCRMRFPYKNLQLEITKKSALIRELHVYGTAVGISNISRIKNINRIKNMDEAESTQHKGYGKKLLAIAERIAAEHGKNKIVVISGIGAREYYKKLGYKKEGSYMIKKIE